MGVDGGFDTQTDAEVHFSGSLESDSGLKFQVFFEIEGANETHDHKATVGGNKDGVTSTKGGDDTELDEAFVRVTGSFGQIELGQRDPIHARTHYAAGFGAGVGLNAGDTQNWIPGTYLETAGWTIPGDNRNIIYISPRVNGVQVGLSYGPDSKNENSAGGDPKNNDDAVWAAGINFNETIGDMAFKVSLGHVNVSNSGMLEYNADNAAAATDDMVKGFEDKTFTNAGISLGMGAFTLAASYATRDDGGYVAQCLGDAASTSDNNADNDTVVACGTLPKDKLDTADDEATGLYPGPAGGKVNSVMAIEDESGQSDTWAVGITYSDGPMTLSVDHVLYEREDGAERTATGLSAGYKLAPGVDWKTSIFAVEDDTGTDKAATAGIDESMAEGTVFVTGLDIHF